MDIEVTITYSTDDENVNESIATLLETCLPYMVDNVEIHFDTLEH